jgi:hypothetical protein
MWQPGEIKYPIESFQTSTGVVRVKTDAGIGYLKALGNSQGPHSLVRELVGTSIAKFLGLKTLEFTTINVLPDDEILLGTGEIAQCGPAFITKEEPTAISGLVEMKKIGNKNHFAGLIIADTLLLNRDRFPGIVSGKPNYDNLMFSKSAPENKKYELIAMDFSHCMHISQSINRTLKQIDSVKNESICGLFPDFKDFINAESIAHFKDKLQDLDESCVNTILEVVPPEWDFNQTTKEIVHDFLVGRAYFLYDNIERLLAFELNGGMLL